MVRAIASLLLCADQPVSFLTVSEQNQGRGGLNAIPRRKGGMVIDIQLDDLHRSRILLATDSTIGPSVRHGPHHGAQKSTSTGCLDSNTICLKLLSSTSAIH